MTLEPWQSVIMLFGQTICYGVYIPTFVACLRWLMFEPNGWKLQPYKQMSWGYITIAILIFAIATADSFLSFFITLVRLAGEQSLAYHIEVASVALEGSTLIIIDAVLIFRCWIVYGKSWRVIRLPLVFWTCTVTCAFVWSICNGVGLDLLNYPTALAVGVGVFYGCNLTTNVFANSAIVYRVWNSAMATNKHSRLYEVCRLLSGTGILYSITSFCSAMAAFSSIRSIFPLAVVNAINFPTACIVYNLVIIRVGQLRACPKATGANLVYNSTGPATKDIQANTLIHT